jgi:DNA repair protein RecO (recombination protein O)
VRVQLQPAFVLHSRHYRDSSALLEVFTPDYGRIGLVAKGARRTTRGSSAGAILQPFIPLLLSFSGRSELKTLTGSEVASRTQVLRGEHLFSGIYLNELLVRLLHRDDPHPGLFIAYGNAVGSLRNDAGETGAGVLDDILRSFEFTLLDELGYGFDLRIDGHSGDTISENRRYQYHQEFGLVALREEFASKGPVFSGRELLEISRGQYNESSRRAAKQLLRQALAGYLGDKPLKSRELFRRTGVRGKSTGERK